MHRRAAPCWSAGTSDARRAARRRPARATTLTVAARRHRLVPTAIGITRQAYFGIEESCGDHTDVHAVPAHPAGGSGRRGGTQPPAAGARRLRPPGRARASTAGCRWATGCCATSSASSARRWTPSAPRRCISPRCCPVSPTRRPAAGPSTATTCSGSRTARAGTTCSGPTHEEMFTLLVKDIVSSYKSLPLALYQIQTKYRDEARPRAGILRGREFVMKDSYSFDLDDAGLAASYQRHRDAYIRIFDRLGLRYVIVAAMSGAMGGSASEEFLADAEVGEDTYVKCSNCDYAANVEAVQIPAAPPSTPPACRPRTSRTPPRRPTIDTLVAMLNERFPRTDRPWSAGDTLKNVAGAAAAPRRQHRAAGDRRARRPRGRPQAARGAGRARRGRAVHRGALRGQPRPGQGLHRTRRAGRRAGHQDPLPARPPDRARARPG